ncbi:hypothetical protein [Candidatus Protochlamydia amoebophila]|uniref:Peptidase M16 middle/third domain-containing protein n=1 Tax=Candidatus Protochlamydia amoebophila TaxID=362787 RepID=A0A0C1JIP2_9BACT|nr:hypothetical protein [Candidatus Protochlamydia amoebophila]KIC71260.1 hypothetical protein DB44_EC00360 [Candidatus Protochlamydia amoebophila]
MTFPKQTLNPQSFDAQIIQYFLQSLTPHQAVITIIAPQIELPICLTKKEKWLKIDYDVQKFSEKQLKSWDEEPSNLDLCLCPIPILLFPIKQLP